MSALVLEWRRADVVRVGWVPQPSAPAIPAAIVGPPGANGSGSAVTSVAGRTGAVALAKADVGLSSVDNTADSAKPVSSAQATAIALKLSASAVSAWGLTLVDDADAATARATIGLGTAATQPAGAFAAAAHTHVIADVTGLQTTLDGKQPLATVLTNTTASFTSAKDSKLSGIATGATANDTDANLKARANHTGMQAVGTITGNWPVAQLNSGAAASSTTFWRGDGTWATPAGGSSDPLVLAQAPTTPPVASVTLGRRSFAGTDLLAMRGPQGVERLVQPHMGRATVVKVEGAGGSTSLGYIGTYAGHYAVLGTASTRAPVATSMATRAKRIGYVSPATAGSFAGLVCQSTSAYASTIGDGSGLGGFFAILRFVPSDAATVSGARMFVGLRPQGTPSNVEPSSLTNAIGVAQLSTGGNLQIVYGGTAAQTAIDLGTSFPAGGLSADLYELALFSDPNDNTKVGYRVERLNTGDVASGTLTNTTPGTTLPSANTMIGFGMWRTNNTTALAVGLDMVSMSMMTDF